MKKILCLALALVMAMSLATVAWGAPVDCSSGCTDAANHVAAVGDNHYTDLQEAIKDAAPNGTVNILKDVTVAEWIMFAENMTSGSGAPIKLNINGLTINGNGHELTVSSVNSADNGKYLFYDAENLNIYDLTINAPKGLGLQSGVIDGVTFNGGGSSVLPGTGDITINECVFNTTGTAIYFEEARDNLVVTNNEFNVSASEVASFVRGDMTFTNNKVNSGYAVSIVSTTADVSGNTFNTPVEVWASDMTLSDNSFTANGKIVLGDPDDDTDVTGVDVSGNYWGGSAPTDTQLGGATCSTYATTNTNGVLGGLVDPNAPPAPQPPVNYPVYYPPVVEDTTVDSAQTFDAGIALYVGVTVAAAFGSVTLSKKRED